MNDRTLSAEVESLIQGYVEGELAAPECARFRELVEASPNLVAPLLTSLRTDTLIRQTVLQEVGFESEAAQDAPVLSGPGKWWGSSRPARLALAACLMLVAALAAVLFCRQQSRPTGSAIRSTAKGSILYEQWNDIPGITVTDLASHPNFQQAPTASQWLANFEAPSNQGQNYGARVRGYLHPPVSGDYLFWIASDDAGELWLSEDENPANKRRVCFADTWTPPREWTWNPSQQSPSIRLEAGHRYYIEALHKQGAAGDYLAVAWQAPGGVREIIPGRVLSAVSPTSVPAP